MEPSRTLMSGLVGACLMLATAVAASAQTPLQPVTPPGSVSQDLASSKLVTVLTLGLPCGGELSTMEAIRARGLESGAQPDELRVALDRVSSDSTFCEPIRNAASTLMVDLAVAAAGEVAADNQAALAASATFIAETLDQADKRAREQGFQVGAPPRNLTRSRISGS